MLRLPTAGAVLAGAVLAGAVLPGVAAPAVALAAPGAARPQRPSTSTGRAETGRAEPVRARAPRAAGGCAAGGAHPGHGSRARASTDHARRPLEAPATVHVTVVHVGDGAVVVAGVCVDGTGPLPFLVDSGSSISVVDTRLARRLHLTGAGPPRRAAGIACTATVSPVRVTHWSLGGETLAAQTVVTHSLPTIATRQPLDGIVGSDVLSRFAAVRIDYRTSTLSLATDEGPPLRPGLVVGPAGGPDPALVGHEIRADVGLDVESHDGEVAAFAPVRLGATPARPFLVDTGAATTAVAASLEHSLHLAPAPGDERVVGFGCPATLHEARSGPWSVGATRLTPQPVAIVPANGAPVDGLLGSDVFLRAGSVVIDYRAARLVLEAG